MCSRAQFGLSRSFVSGSSHFKFSNLKVELSEDKSPVQLPAEKPFGMIPTRHMFTVDYENGKWGTPKIVPFGMIPIHPFNSGLHYAISCFDGFKAYKDSKGQVRLFRPDVHVNRLVNSTSRLALPPFNPDEFMKCLHKYVWIEKDWIPTKKGESLYIRPIHFGAETSLGVRPSTRSKLMIVSCPVGSYFEGGLKPISLEIYRDYERGTPRSAAGYKIGANYAPTVKISGEMKQKHGADQVLWVYGDKILEVGACNIFFLFKSKDGKLELITAPLDGSILPGVTRQSILELERAKKRFHVQERHVTVPELFQVEKEGRLVEVFGCGTGVTIMPVGKLIIDSKSIKTKANESEAGSTYARSILDELQGIMYGEINHPYSVVVKEQR